MGHKMNFWTSAEENPPTRDDWQINPNAGTSQNDPVFVPIQPLHPRLCEKLVIVRAR